MTTFADQPITTKTWTAVTGMTLAQNYGIQNKTNDAMHLVEAPTAPTGGAEGRVFRAGDVYFLTKGADDVFVFFLAGPGLVVVNEGA